MSELSVVVYSSRAVIHLTDLDLYYLLAHARERNRERGLGGVMLYDRGYFFQWIEGNNQTLGKTWNSIRADSRHTDIRVLADQQIPIRLFADWSMQLAHRPREHESIADGLIVADPLLLDDLHINPGKIPSILASFSSLGGSFKTVAA